ncbi:preprotein translocase subunit SecG [Candidatus Purcelliella pentastirinorum]|uniref:Protein-export membrane protein SecG n=1 Tax=Candidatus Purcelliella pentastirinorum TaxID=472834 RepID=A0AAX3N8L3_9ENTR|nr:preprotein translocase subunit SecG [Candidatus Purcelliella pentastirinorum]WDI78344.1 preprotein translocase subunit SecG [Candidatus Purcelliella pentastirinorum]WDR80628.1 preprotein translocase subunit SecG [Candidatus Purcelliella pentastirinorum]
MNNFFLILFLVTSFILTALILIQKNNNIEVGKSLNINNVMSIIDNKYSNNIINNLIYILSILFFIISLLLNNYNFNKNIYFNKWEHINTK